MAVESLKQSSSLTWRAIWMIFARTVAFAISFCLPLVLVRRLDQIQFGLYKQVFLIVGTAVNLLPLGFHMSAFYFLPRERDRQGQIVLNILLFYISIGGLACLTMVFRPTLLSTIFPSSGLVGYAPLIGLILLLWIASSFLEYVAVANQETKLATIFIVTMQLTKTLLLLSAAILFSSVRSLIYAAIIQGILQVIVALTYLKVSFKGFWRSFNWNMFHTQISYALPLGFAGLFYTLQMDAHNYFVSNRFGPAAYAVYAIGSFDLPLIGILSDSVGMVMIPRVSYLQKHDQRHEIVLVISRMMRKLAVIYFAAYAFLLVAGREFITVLFTSRYIASWPIFAINLTMIPLMIITSACDPVMRAYAEHRYFLLRVRAVMVVVLLVALWLGTDRLGMVGVISMVVGVNLIERLVTVVKAGGILGVTRRDLVLLKDIGKLAVATTMAAITTTLVRPLVIAAKPFIVLLICGLVFGSVYLSVVLLLRVISTDEREAILGRIARLKQLSLWRRAANPLA